MAKADHIKKLIASFGRNQEFRAAALRIIDDAANQGKRPFAESLTCGRERESRRPSHAARTAIWTQPNLKTAQSERPRRMSKIVEGVFVPRLISQNERLWNDPLWRKADKTVVASIRLAGGCEGSHDFVDAGFKLGDRERFLKKRKRGRILTHRLIIIDAPPLCIHRDLRPVSAAMEAGRNKARRPTH